MIEFVDDDARYLKWLDRTPDGFVLNLRWGQSRNYIVLHTAKCWMISKRGRGDGAYTARGYRKICAESIRELRTAAKEQGRQDGTFSKVCKTCSPGTNA